MADDGIPYMGCAIRTDRYRFVKCLNWNTREEVASELYDLHSDPQENKNVVDAPQHQGLLAELRQRLDAGWAAATPK